MTDSPDKQNEPAPIQATNASGQPRENSGQPTNMPEQAAGASSRRPRMIIAAEALLIIAALLWIPVATTGLELVLLAVYVVFALRAFGGRPTARNAVLGMAILLSVWMTFVAVAYAQGNQWIAVLGALALVSCWVGVVLLYRPSSNAYFRASEHAPRAQPGSITAAGFLLVVSALAWAPLVNEFLLQIMGLLLLVYVVFALRALGGRSKARSVVTIAATLLMVQLLPFAWLGFTSPASSTGAEDVAVVNILAMASSCAGLMLLYLRSNDAYFHESEKRRQLRRHRRDVDGGLPGARDRS